MARASRVGCRTQRRLLGPASFYGVKVVELLVKLLNLLENRPHHDNKRGDRRLFERRLHVTIITISRGSYSKGKEIAEKVAQELNYEHTYRDVLLEASEHFNVPEIKLVRPLLHS